MKYIDLDVYERCATLLFMIDTAFYQELVRQADLLDQDVPDGIEQAIAEIRHTMLGTIGVKDFAFVMQYYGQSKVTERLKEFMQLSGEEFEQSALTMTEGPEFLLEEPQLVPTHITNLTMIDIERVLLTLGINSIMEMKHMFNTEILGRDTTLMDVQHSSHRLINRTVTETLDDSAVAHLNTLFQVCGPDAPFKTYLNTRFGAAQVDPDVMPKASDTLH